MDCSPRLLCPWDSPRKNTAVGSHSPLQGIFPSPGCVLHWHADSVHWATWETLVAPSLPFIRIKVWKLVGYPGGSVIKNRHANAGNVGREDPLQKEMAIHSSILAWGIPWTEKPSRLQSMGSQRVGHNLATKQRHQYTRKQTRKPVNGAASIQQMYDRGSGVDQ